MEDIYKQILQQIGHSKLLSVFGLSALIRAVARQPSIDADKLRQDLEAELKRLMVDLELEDDIFTAAIHTMLKSVDDRNED